MKPQPGKPLRSPRALYVSEANSPSILSRVAASFSIIFVLCVLNFASTKSALSSRDEAFLEDLSRRSFRYFWEQADARTGLVLDRARADGRPHDETHRNVASIAATGFGLTALCIAAERRWISPDEAHGRVLATLRFLAERAPHERGWFYHWLDAVTGERRWQSEVSSIDTALLLGGVLTAREYFRGDAEIVRLATLIYERVDFPWMLNAHPTLLSHGYKPETGFLKPRWDTYSEDTILYMLAIGSPSHPITPRAWYAWKREWITYAGYKYLFGAPPLFIHQYSHAWVDYRNRREATAPHTDYFANSIKATRAHRAFCMSLARKFPLIHRACGASPRPTARRATWPGEARRATRPSMAQSSLARLEAR